MPLASYSVAQARPLTRVLKWEVDPIFSRENIVVLAGNGADRILDVGTVFGRRTKAAPIITPDGGNTGNGGLGALVLKKPALPGSYTVVCIAAAANGGTFAVIDPNGRRLEDAEVGTTLVTPDLDFLISDGAADFAVGDFFTIDIQAGDGKVTEIDFAATDGTADAYGIIGNKVTAPDGADANGLGIVRQAIVAKGELIWPGGATQAQIDLALAELKTAGILAKTEA